LRIAAIALERSCSPNVSNQPLLATRAVKQCQEVIRLIEARARQDVLLEGMATLETIAKAVMTKEALGRATSPERVRILTDEFLSLTGRLEPV
jgi:hypothetical protein